MRPRVLLYGSDPYATVFLKQRGISYAAFPRDREAAAGSILWVLEPVRGNDAPGLQRFHLSGGHLLGAASCLQPLIPLSTSPLWIENIRGDHSCLFFGINNLLLKMRGVRIHDAQAGITNDQYPSVAVCPYENGAGTVIALPFDLRNIREQGVFIKRILFHDRVYDEMVAGRSYHLINRLLFNCLCELASQDGGTLATGALFPEPAVGGISFRIDADYYHAEGWEALIGLFAGHEKQTTVFMNTWSHRYRHGFIRKLQSLGFDVQSHAHVHAGYADYRRNYVNLRRSAAILKKLGIDATGSAAPYGLWSGNYMKALEAGGFTFSTEFGYEYLDLPARAIDESGRVSPVLHCSVFPLALEKLLAGGDRTLCDRFVEYVRSEIFRGNHISVYLHPNSGVVAAYSCIRYVLEKLYQMERCWFGSLSALQKLYICYERGADGNRLVPACFTRGGVRVFPGGDNANKAHVPGVSIRDPWVELDYKPLETMTFPLLVETVLIAIKAWLRGKGYLQRTICMQEAVIRMLGQLKGKNGDQPSGALRMAENQNAK